MSYFEIMERCDRVLKEVGQIQDLARSAIVDSLQGNGDLSRYFWQSIDTLKIDRGNKAISEVLIKMHFAEKGLPTTKRFKDANQVKQVLKAIVETVRIHEEVRRVE
jgi:hypothetical protein